jgi:nucleoid DNA-binding protein
MCLGVSILNKNNDDILVITKENFINIITDKCENDYVSMEDLFVLINEATDKKTRRISKKKLIKSIKNSHTKSVVKDIYNILEDTIFDTLYSVNAKQDVSIRLFEGISLDGKYVPEKTKKNNLTGEISLVESKIKPKFNITRNYCEKLNYDYDE